jgi:hypothetical protein
VQIGDIRSDLHAARRGAVDCEMQLRALEGRLNDSSSRIEMHGVMDEELR